MKKKIRKITIMGILTFACFCVTTEASVGWKTVLKLHEYDFNLFTLLITTHRKVNIEVPSSAKFMYSEEVKIVEGWNYDRYRITNYYESDLGWH